MSEASRTGDGRRGEAVCAALTEDGVEDMDIVVTAKHTYIAPFANAGWLRYLIGADDAGNPMELSPDPMIPYLKEHLAGIAFGKPESLTDQLKPILSNETLFGMDLYAAGLGDKIETMVREELAGAGAVRATLKKYLDNVDVTEH